MNGYTSLMASWCNSVTNIYILAIVFVLMEKELYSIKLNVLKHSSKPKIFPQKCVERM